MKEQGEKTRSRTPVYEDMPSTRGKLWLYPNSTDPQMAPMAKMYKRERGSGVKHVTQLSLCAVTHSDTCHAIFSKTCDKTSLLTVL